MDLDPRPEILSPHFTLSEMEHSATALAHGIPNVATPADVRRLTDLCRSLLEPIRDRFGPIHVDSGYRSARVNELVGGSRTSAHRWGLAADIWSADGSCTCEDIWRWVVSQDGLPWDQLIWERRYARRSEWVHVGLAPPPHNAPRRMAWKNWR